VNSEYDKRLSLQKGLTWPLTIGENQVYNPVLKQGKKTKGTRMRKLEKL